MAKAKRYEFEQEMVTITTPKAETFFMCVTEPSEYTDSYGGGLIFKDDILDTPVTVTVGKKKQQDKVPFRQVVDDMIDASLKEYIATTKKKATRADKLVEHIDKDGNVIDGVMKLTCKNNEAIKVFDKYGKINRDFDETVYNGSEVKAKLKLVPYVMQGKVGVTAYINSIQIIELVEMGEDDGGFDDESGDDDMPDWDDNDATGSDNTDTDDGDY